MPGSGVQEGLKQLEIQFLEGYQPHSTVQTADKANSQYAYENSLFTQIGASVPEAYVRITRGYGRALRECRPGNTSFVLSLGLKRHFLFLSWKKLILSSGGPIFAIAARGHFQITRSGGQQTPVLEFTGLCGFAYFESCCLIVCLQVSLKLYAD